MAVSLGELAVRFGCELRGDPDVQVEHVSTLDGADARSIAFVTNARYKAQLARTRAGAVVLDKTSVDACPTAALIADNPHATYARIATVLHPLPRGPRGIHATAVVAPGAKIDPTAHIGPLSVIGAGVVIGPRVFVGPHCVLEDRVELAEDVYLVAHVTLCREVLIGERTIIQPGAIIGGDGFGFARERDGRWIKVPQVGTVQVGPDVEIGANTTIDRGAIGDTVIEEGVKLDNLIMIAHNVRVGAHSALAACVGISGSTTLGKRVMMGGSVGVGGHLTIVDDVVITGCSMVSHSIMKSGTYSGGIPIEEARIWRRLVGRLKRLDLLGERVKRLEQATGTLPHQEETDD